MSASSGTVTGDDLALFLEELRLSLVCRLPVADVFRSLAAATRSKRKRSRVLEAADAIASGARLSEMHASAAGLFGNETLALFRAGEVGGNLPAVLERYVMELEKRAERAARLSSTLLSPGAILVIVFLVAALVTIEARGAVAGFFGTAGLPLVSSSLAVLGGLLFPVVLLAAGFIAWRQAVPGGRSSSRKPLLLSLPFVRGIFLEETRARLFRTLGLLLKEGVALPEALRIAAETVPEPDLAAEVMQAAAEVARGLRWPDVLPQGRLISATDQLVLSGAAERLPVVLERMGSSSEQEADRLSRWAVAAAQVVLAIGVGIVAATFIISAFSIYFESVGRGFAL